MSWQKKNWPLQLCSRRRTMPHLDFLWAYRKSNAVKQGDSYPITGMDECRDSLRDARLLFTLDANCSFLQEEVEGIYRDKTEFTLHHRLSQFNRRPFRLRNACENFKQPLEIILSPAKWQLSLVYLDSMIIFYGLWSTCRACLHRIAPTEKGNQ